MGCEAGLVQVAAIGVFALAAIAVSNVWAKAYTKVNTISPPAG